MSRTTVPPPWRRARGLLARPTDPVEHSRWVFLLLALASLVLAAPGALVGAGAGGSASLAASCLVLAVSWTVRYRVRSASIPRDLLDVLAVSVFALSSSLPVVAFGIALPALWARVMYGRTRRVAAYVAAVGLGLLAAALVRGCSRATGATLTSASSWGRSPCSG